jgi:hypothetical protein
MIKTAFKLLLLEAIFLTGIVVYKESIQQIKQFYN